MVLNTSGGLTSGDNISLSVEVQAGASCSVTTQAAERAYRAPDAAASVRSAIWVEEEAEVLWLPQELILFDGARLQRELTCDLAATSKLLVVEPVIFGRHAMGETLSHLEFRDTIRITREARPLFQDVTLMEGDASELLTMPALAMGMGAMVTLIYIAPDAEAKQDAIGPHLTNLCGASMVHRDALVVRALAEDGFGLRRMLLPVLDILTNYTLPVSWRL